MFFNGKLVHRGCANPASTSRSLVYVVYAGKFFEQNRIPHKEFWESVERCVVCVLELPRHPIPWRTQPVIAMRLSRTQLRLENGSAWRSFCFVPLRTRARPWQAQRRRIVRAIEGQALRSGLGCSLQWSLLKSILNLKRICHMCHMTRFRRWHTSSAFARQRHYSWITMHRTLRFQLLPLWNVCQVEYTLGH